MGCVPRVALGSDLSRAQPGACVGLGVVEIKPLLGGVQQIHAPDVGVETGQDGLVALEELVVQAHANLRTDPAPG